MGAPEHLAMVNNLLGDNADKKPFHEASNLENISQRLMDPVKGNLLVQLTLTCLEREMPARPARPTPPPLRRLAAPSSSLRQVERALVSSCTAEGAASSAGATHKWPA